MFDIITTDGVVVNQGPGGNGYTEAQAAASVKERNERAMLLGVSARYTTRDHIPTPHKA